MPGFGDRHERTAQPVGRQGRCLTIPPMTRHRQPHAHLHAMRFVFATPSWYTGAGRAPLPPRPGKMKWRGARIRAKSVPDVRSGASGGTAFRGECRRTPAMRPVRSDRGTLALARQLTPPALRGVVCHGQPGRSVPRPFHPCRALWRGRWKEDAGNEGFYPFVRPACRRRVRRPSQPALPMRALR